MADVSVPNQPVSAHRSLLNESPSFLHITHSTWSQTGPIGNKSHNNTHPEESEIPIPCPPSSRQDTPSFRSSSMDKHIEETSHSDNGTSQSSSPLIQGPQSPLESSERSLETQGSPSEEEIYIEQPMTSSTSNTHDISQSAMDLTPVLPSQEDAPADSSITTTRQVGHSDSDLNTNFSFPMQPASEKARRLDELYLATHAPTPRARPRPPRAVAHDLPAFNFGLETNNSHRSGPLSPELPFTVASSTEPQVGDSVGLSPSQVPQPEVQNHATRWNLGPPSGQSFHRHRRSGAALSISADGPALPSRLRPFGSAPSTPVELPQFSMEDQMAHLHTSPSTSPTTEFPPSPRRGSAPSLTRRRPIPTSASFQPRPLSTIASDSGSNSSIDKEIVHKVRSGTSSPLPAETFHASIDSTLDDEITRTDLDIPESILSSMPTPTPQKTVDLDLTPRPNPDLGTGNLLTPSTPEKSSTSVSSRLALSDPSQISVSSTTQSLSFASDQGPSGGRSRGHPQHRRAESSGENPRPRTSPGRAQSEQPNDFNTPLPDFPSSPLGASRKEKSRRLEADPASQSSLTAQEVDFQFPASINFDDESATAVLEAPSTVPFKTASPQYSPLTINDDLVLEPTSSQSNSPLPSPSSEEYLHVIDLDAGSGSLSEGGPDSLSSSATAAMQRRMRMHSSGGRGGYSGAAMQFHRRAESAPEMPPPSFPGVSRMGSNTEMADVFEEEEEEPGAIESASLDDVQKEDFADQDGRDIVGRPNIPKAAEEPFHEGTERPVDGAVEERNLPLSNEDALVADEEGWSSSIARSSDSTVTPRDLADTPIKRPASAPLEVAVRAPGSFYAPSDFQSSAPSSGFPSPDPASVSFDHPRLPTATSSITDRGTFNSATSGENFWSVRGSVDRTPELTEDDDSMLTGAIPRHSSGAVTNSSFDRSVMTPGIPPVSPVRPGRLATARKRGSLASLSKLMTTPGSKLRNEEKAPDDTSEHVEGKKKNRLSRLIGIFRKS